MSLLVRELSFKSCNCYVLQIRASSAQPTPLAYNDSSRYHITLLLQKTWLSATQHHQCACAVAPLHDCLDSSLISATTGFDFILRQCVDTPKRLHGCYQRVSFLVRAPTTHVRAVTFQ